jgi:tyrosyl-tRNA synthetase
VPQVAGSLAALAEGIDLISFLAETAIAPSKGEARKLLQNGGISINKQKVTEAVFTLRSEHLLQARYVLVQKGKSNYTLAIFN